jgi:hypothetical protein
MDYTVTINLWYLLWAAVFAVVFYIYTTDNSDDRLTQLRNDLDARKEWFRMLAEQTKQKTKSNRRA